MSMNNAKMLYLGKRIKSAREQSGLTQEQLAEKFGIKLLESMKGFE